MDIFYTCRDYSGHGHILIWICVYRDYSGHGHVLIWIYFIHVGIIVDMVIY